MSDNIQILNHDNPYDYFPYILIAIFVIGIICLIIYTFYRNSSNDIQKIKKYIFPFSGQLVPSNPPFTVNSSNIPPGSQGNKTPGSGYVLIGNVGGEGDSTPQIKCPKGYKINIIGAFLDVNDPYNTCTDNPSSLYLNTCGVDTEKSTTRCTENSDCGSGMECVKNICKVKSCSTTTDCSSTTDLEVCKGLVDGEVPEDGNCGPGSVFLGQDIGCVRDPGQKPCTACSNGKCKTFPTCNFADENGYNKLCNPFTSDKTLYNQYQCKPRDASAYLSSYCDGKENCLGEGDIWYPNNPKNNPFGPLPCRINAPETVNGNSKYNTENIYSTLPVSTGWGGKTPSKGQQESSPTFNQGYYVHGIYTCIPDDELKNE